MCLNLLSQDHSISNLKKITISQQILTTYVYVVCVYTNIQEPAIKGGKSWRSLDLSHNYPSSTLSATTSNSSSGGTTQNSLLTVSTHRNHYDFKTRRSSSEPVHDQQVFLQSAFSSEASTSSSANSQTNKVLTPTTSKDTNANNDLLPEDDVPTKEDGFIDCLQNMTNINKVSQKNNSTQNSFQI